MAYGYLNAFLDNRKVSIYSADIEIHGINAGVASIMK